MRNFAEIVGETSRSIEEYRKRLDSHLALIKEVSSRFFGPEVEVYLFGSTVRGEERPLSDIDVAVVLNRRPNLEERMNFLVELRHLLGIFHPFEVHVIGKEEWERWYRRFVKEYRRV